MNTTILFSCRLRKRDAESGFTLLEVMITIAIVAILLGLSVPSLRAYMENRYASSQAETLAGELRKAQIEAIKRNVGNCPHRDQDAIVVVPRQQLRLPPK